MGPTVSRPGNGSIAATTNLTGVSSPFLKALTGHAPAQQEALQCAQYFRNNRQRIRYPEFLAQELCTSPGVVEAGCKATIGTRFKRAGMHWTEFWCECQHRSPMFEKSADATKISGTPLSTNGCCLSLNLMRTLADGTV